MFQDEIDLIIKKNKVLIDKAIHIMEKVPDAMHSVSHMQSVVNYTIEILKNEKKANKEVCIISAYWHDVGRSVQNKDHAIISADMLKEEMRKSKYDDEMIEACYQAIYKHSWYDMPDTLEGLVVRDADKIDFIGIGRWKQCISAKHSCESILKLLPTLRSDLLQLECSRKIYDREVAKLVGYLHGLVFSADKEIWDILDEEGNITGRTVEKGDKLAWAEGIYHQGADVWIINSENKILIQKRAPEKKLQPNVWAMTGGSVIKGESSLDTLKRETFEELGIDLNVENAIKIKHYKTANVWLDEYIVKQDIELSNIVMQKEEVSDVKFASFDEIEKLYQDKKFMKNRWEFVRDEIEKYIKN